MSTSSLVVQTSFLGDVVLTTPLIHELAARGPVDVVVRPDAAALLAGNPDVRSVVVYDKRGRDRGPRGLLRVGRQLRALGATHAYLAQGSVRSALLARVARCAHRAGFETSRQARALYTRAVPYRADRHHAERLWSLAVPDDAAPSVEQLRPRLYPTAADHAAADALLGERNDLPLVALAPGSVWATKRWPHYAALAARVAERARVVVVGGAGDRGLAHEIVTTCPPGRAIDATGRLSLLASAALLARCAALVTNDSAPQHLASAVGIPTLTIFGPTVPEFGFGPLAPESRTLGHAGLDCRPCDRHGPQKCPLTHWRCMRELAVDDVLRALPFPTT